MSAGRIHQLERELIPDAERRLRTLEEALRLAHQYQKESVSDLKSAEDGIVAKVYEAVPSPDDRALPDRIVNGSSSHTGIRGAFRKAHEVLTQGWEQIRKVIIEALNRTREELKLLQQELRRLLGQHRGPGQQGRSDGSASSHGDGGAGGGDGGGGGGGGGSSGSG